MNALHRIPGRARMVLVAALVLLAAGALEFMDANPAASQTTTLRAGHTPEDPGLDPDNAAWARAAAIDVPLVAQAGSYVPGGGSIPVVTAQALHHDGILYVRVEWPDSTHDESTYRVEDFADGVALEFPARAANTVPSICMGQANAGVNIWHWRADSEAGPQDPATVYQNTLSDGNPLEFYTARDAGNPFAQLDASPVQNLVARAFGTLARSDVQDVAGHGVYRDGKWSVVFARAFETNGGSLATFKSPTTTDMAFAVWNGSEGDRNGRKSISQFVTLSVSNSPASDGGTATWALVLGATLLLGVTVIGFGLAIYGYGQDGRR